MPKECQCDLRTKLVGDGCEVCNPALALEYAKQTIDDLRAEVEALRAAALRQWKADASLYAMPHDCSRDEHIAALDEHDAAHAALGALLTPNAVVSGERSESA
jgi:hypothetical protein